MKAIYYLSLCALFSISVEAQVRGPNSPSSVTTSAIAGSNASWTNLNFAIGSDDQYATFGNISGNKGDYTNYLVARGFNFSIPPGATILGIKVDVERSDPNGLTSDFRVRIVKGDNIGATEHASATAYFSADSYLSYGGNTDLWGETWTDKDIVDNRFGVAISAVRNSPGGSTAGQIDDINITVYYFVTLPVNIISFSAAKNNNSVNLDWTTGQESALDHYDVERSTDGRNFNTIGRVPSHIGSSNHYSFIDNNPLNKIAYYRLKVAELNGSEKFSKIVSVQWSTGNSISLFPNPLREGDILHISNPNKENLTLRFYDLAGKMVLSLTTSSDQISPESLKGKRGTFVYRVSNTVNQTTESGQIVIK